MKNAKRVHVQDMVSLFSDLDKTASFRWNIRFSIILYEKDVILEPCSETEEVIMLNLGGLFALYFLLARFCHS